MSQPEFEILKRDDAKRLVFGFASVAVNVDGSPLTDSQGDQIEPAELERAAYDYVLKSREGTEMHSRRNVARIVESFVVTPEKLQKMGLAEDAVPCGWWIGMKISDDATWEKVQKGELRAFSIGGKARRVEAVEKGDYEGHPFRGNQWTGGEGSGGEGVGGAAEGGESSSESDDKELAEAGSALFHLERESTSDANHSDRMRQYARDADLALSTARGFGSTSKETLDRLEDRAKQAGKLYTAAREKAARTLEEFKVAGRRLKDIEDRTGKKGMRGVFGGNVS